MNRQHAVLQRYPRLPAKHRICPQAIIYVVDSSDTERIGISREEFHAILSEDELKDALVLVYANKQVRAANRPCPAPLRLIKSLCARLRTDSHALT